MTREQKIKKDAKALRGYRERLEKERMVYHRNFDLVAINRRTSRQNALGACLMKAMESVQELAKTKKLVKGSLYYIANELKVKDPNGRKGFLESVTFYVMSEEKAHTKEQIDEEIEKTFEKMMQETDEMFPPEDKSVE